MATEIKVLNLEEGLLDYIEFLNYNVEAYKKILTEIITKTDKNGRCLYSLENYRHFMNEYKEAFQEYGIVTRQIMIDHAPEYIDDDNYELFFDFSNKEAKIQRKEISCQTGGCSCGK